MRLASAGSRRSSISSASDDGLNRGNTDTHTRGRTPSQQQIFSPAFSETQLPPTPDYQSQKGATPNTYHYERASLASLPPRPQRKSVFIRSFKRPRWLRWFRQKYWAPEVLSLFASLLLFLVLIALLVRFNHTPYQDWTFPITLNALISAIVQFLVLCLIVPVSSCLGQLKWNRFRRHGGLLREFDLHDQASRTAWGSAKLIWKKPTQVHGLLLAFTTVAINVIAPFLQQIVSIRDATDYVTFQASVPVAYSYIETGDPTVPVDQLTQFSVNQAMFSLVSSGYPVYPNVGFGQNATWDKAYATLGVVSQCQDITDKMTRKDISTQNDPNTFFKAARFDIALPNGHNFSSTIGPGDGAANAKSLQSFSIDTSKDSIAFKDKGNVLVDFTAIYVPPVSRSFPGTISPVAVECILQFAGFPYKAFMTAGLDNPGPFVEIYSQGDTYIVDNSEAAQKASPWLHRANSQTPNTGTSNSPICVNMTVPTDPSNPGKLSTCFTTNSKLATFLAGLFSGHVTTTASPNAILRNDSQINSQSDAVSSLASIIGGPPPTSEVGFDISKMMNHTASSITNNIRTASDASTKGSINGTAHGSMLLYEITWPWAAPLVILIALTLMLLIWTAIDTRRKNLPVWSTSCLADLIHGLDTTTRSTLVTITETEQLENASENIRVFLRPGDKTLAAVDSGPLSGTAPTFEFEDRPGGMQRPTQMYDTDHRYSGT